MSGTLHELTLRAFPCPWGWCWTGLCVCVCVVVARCVDNDVPFLWFDLILCEFEQKGCVYKKKKKKKKLETSWCGVCVFLFFSCFVFVSLDCARVPFSILTKRISELFLTAVSSLFYFSYFSQEHKNLCRIQNCPWLCLCLFIDLYIEILFCIVHSLLSWL